MDYLFRYHTLNIGPHKAWKQKDADGASEVSELGSRPNAGLGGAVTGTGLCL